MTGEVPAAGRPGTAGSGCSLGRKRPSAPLPALSESAASPLKLFWLGWVSNAGTRAGTTRRGPTRPARRRGEDRLGRTLPYGPYGLRHGCRRTTERRRCRRTTPGNLADAGFAPLWLLCVLCVFVVATISPWFFCVPLCLCGSPVVEFRTSHEVRRTALRFGLLLSRGGVAARGPGGKGGGTRASRGGAGGPQHRLRRTAVLESRPRRRDQAPRRSRNRARGEIRNSDFGFGMPHPFGPGRVPHQPGMPGCWGAIRNSKFKTQNSKSQALGSGPRSSSSRHSLPRLTLLASDHRGYRNLCRLLTEAARGRQKGKARATWQQVAAHADGLHCLTGGAEGVLAQRLVHRGLDAARRELEHLNRLFPRRLHVELQRHRLREEEHRNRALIDLARSLRLPLAATGGIRYARPENRDLADVLATHPARA